MPSISEAYYTMLARIESNNNPLARATTSTASGLYQFTRSTWEGLGGTWGDQSGQPFGGRSIPVTEQRQRVEVLTSQNARTLESAGIPINNATLYAAHFLGPSGARRLLTANPNTPISEVTTADQRRANRSILGTGTVQDFFNWLRTKTGTTVNGNVTSQVTTQTNTAPGVSEPFTGASAFGNIISSIPGLGGLPSILGGAVAPIINSNPADLLEAGGNALEELNPVTGILEFFRTLFSQETAIRFIVVIIGIAAIAAAFASVIMTNSNPIATITKGLKL